MAEFGEAKLDGFADIREGFGHGLTLRIAAGNGGTDHDVAALVRVGLEEDFEIARGHWIHRSGGDSAKQAMTERRAAQSRHFGAQCKR